MASIEPKRLFQVWKGSNIFLFGGRLIFGPDATSLFLTVALIVTPSITFCSQLIVKVIHRSYHSYYISEKSILPILIVTMFVTLWDLIFLFLTSSRDPGIITRNSHPLGHCESLDAATSVEWMQGRHLILPRTKEVTINGFLVRVKYCDTCLLYRPPRASHCSICNNCVQKFDHHCPWVGQCIGIRNYRSFFLFISSSSFLCLYVFIFSWCNILAVRKHYGSLFMSLKREPISVILISYTFCAIWFVGGLTILHIYLISTNQTTYENFRYRYSKKDNPYNKGVFGNFKDIFLSKPPTSMNDFRSWVYDDIYEIESNSSGSRFGYRIQNEQIVITEGDFETYGRNHTPYSFPFSDNGSIYSDSRNGSAHLQNANGTNDFSTTEKSLRQRITLISENKLVDYGTSSGQHFHQRLYISDDHCDEELEMGSIEMENASISIISLDGNCHDLQNT